MRVATKLDILQKDLKPLYEITAQFQKTYIRGNLIGRKRCLFFFWNHYQKTVCVLAQTTNAI